MTPASHGVKNGQPRFAFRIETTRCDLRKRPCFCFLAILEIDIEQFRDGWNAWRRRRCCPATNPAKALRKRIADAG